MPSDGKLPWGLQFAEVVRRILQESGEKRVYETGGQSKIQGNPSANRPGSLCFARIAQIVHLRQPTPQRLPLIEG